MTVETHEDEARRVVMEINRRSITVTANLAKTTWVELRHFIGERLSGSQREPRVGRRVTTRELEQSTRGQRESVNLTDPRTAKLVQKELNRYGVTFAITSDKEGTRVHIGAGNATQLDTAMRRAEQTLARQIEARQAREDRRVERLNPTYEDAQGRTSPESETRSNIESEARQVSRDEPLSPAADRLHPPVTDARLSHVVHEALPEAMAQSVLVDNGWPTLAKSLSEVANAGLDPVAVLGSVVRERETFTSRSVAAVLAWRVDNALQERPSQVIGERAQELPKPPSEPLPQTAARERAVPESGAPTLARAAGEVPAAWSKSVPEAPLNAGAASFFKQVVEQAQLPKETATALLNDKGWPALAAQLTAAVERGSDPVDVLRAAVARGPAPAQRPLSYALADRVRGAESKDVRSVARSALNERARALPKSEVKGDVVDLATEKPTRGLDLGGPRR